MNTSFLSAANVATIVTLLLAAVGAIITIVQPDTLTFSAYLDDMKVLIGGLAIGRGIGYGLKNHGKGTGKE